MKVLFDHQAFTFQAHGGITRYFFELMTRFERAREPAFDLAIRYSGNDYLRGSGFARVKDLVGKRRGAARAALLLYSYLRNRSLGIRRLKAGAHDVFHATFYDPYFLPHRRQVPFVITLFDMIPERFPELFPARGLYARLVTRRWIEAKRMLAARADAILAISERTKQDAVQHFGLDPARVTVTPLGGSLSPSETVPPGALPESYLLYVGARWGYKNFLPFVEAVSPLLRRDPLLHLVCVGGGPFTAAEAECLRRNGILPRCHQHPVRDEHLAHYYARARAFVYPSKYEGFGIPIVEAFSCGCPAAVSDTSCFPEIASGAAVYFDPEDPESIRSTVERVLHDETLRSRLAAEGRVRAQDFSWEKTAARTQAVYRTLLA